jgi:putative nucleotidyltransferase with HDIG domain
MGIRYRVHQFFHALYPKLPPDEAVLVRSHLPETLLPLYYQMGKSDRIHSLRVFRALVDAGESDPDLLAAALLHDVGKSKAPLCPLERTMVVLANLFAPDRVVHWGEGDPRGWRKSFVVAIQHPHWGSEMVREYGSSELLAYLIREHQRDPSPAFGEGDELLARLQDADGRN